ncbi:MAG: MATE family efflux transporter [Oscillospiraceae bacterium]|nr:MATE family efflux transporter [Oscillospiraceae bacterium]
MAQTYDMTHGKVTPLILKFYFPLFFTSMLQQIYTVADTAIVGKGIGDNALAAVGNMSAITFLIFGFAMGLTNGFSVSIAQSFGAKQYEKLRHYIASAVCLAAGIAVLLTFLGTFFLKQILTLMQTDALIIQDSLTYGYILLGGMTATIAYNLCAAILRALGDSKTPFLAIIVSSVVNVTLDSLFVFVFKFGVAGAAIATLIAQVLSTFICLTKLLRIDVIHLEKQDFCSNRPYFMELLTNGIPMALMNSITAIGCIVIQFFVNGMGIPYASAYSACNKYINLFMQPACTAGYAASSFISQNYGAKQYRRIKEGLKVCMSIAAIGYLIFGTAMVFFPRQLALLMLNEEESIALAMQYLPISGLLLFAVDFLFVVRSAVQAMGHPTIPMISGIAEMAMRVIMVILLHDIFGFRATAIAEASAWVAAFLLNGIALHHYLRGLFKQHPHLPFWHKHTCDSAHANA